MSRASTIIKDISRYSSSFVLSQMITVIAALLMRRFLGPVQAGVWSLVQVVLTYAQYSHLGTMQAVSLEIPFQNGQGNSDKVKKIQNAVFSFSLLTAFAASAGVLIYAFWQKDNLEPVLWGGLCFAAALVILERLNALLICLLRAYKLFDIASTQMFFSAFVNALLVGVLAFYFRLYGFMTAMALSFLFNIFYILSRTRFRLHFSWDAPEWRALVAYGFPLMLLTLCTTLFETIDRLMIAKFLGLKELGHYSIALMAVSYLFSIPNSMGVVLIPNIHEKYGQTQNKADLKSFLEKSDKVFMVLMPVLIGFAWIAGPILIRLVLPAFEPGITAMFFLTLCVFFSAVGQAYSQFLYAVKKHFVLIPVILGSCLLSIALNYYAIIRGGGISGVAIATAVTYGVYFSVIFYSAASQIWEKKVILKRYFAIMGAFFWMLALLYLIKRIFPGETFKEVLIGTFAWCVLYAPLLFRIEKELGVREILLSKFRRK